jgi:hypothetical protein
MYVNWPALVEELKAGNFHPINIALVGRSMEASGFALDLCLRYGRRASSEDILISPQSRMTCAVAALFDTSRGE